jgi:hypothetical protein
MELMDQRGLRAPPEYPEYKESRAFKGIPDRRAFKVN